MRGGAEPNNGSTGSANPPNATNPQNSFEPERTPRINQLYRELSGQVADYNEELIDTRILDEYFSLLQYIIIKFRGLDNTLKINYFNTLFPLISNSINIIDGIVTTHNVPKHIQPTIRRLYEPLSNLRLDPDKKYSISEIENYERLLVPNYQMLFRDISDIVKEYNRVAAAAAAPVVGDPETQSHTNVKNIFPNTTPPATNPFVNPNTPSPTNPFVNPNTNTTPATNPWKNQEERNAAAKNQNPWRLNEYNYNKKKRTGNPFRDPSLGTLPGSNNSVTFPSSRKYNVPVSMLNNSARRNLMISASAAIKRMGKSADYNELQRQVRELSEALKKCCDDIPEYGLSEREGANASTARGIMGIAHAAAASAPADQRAGIIEKIRGAALSAAKGLAGATVNGISLVAHAAAAAAAAPFIALGSLATRSGKASSKVSPEQVRANPNVQEAADAARQEAIRRGASIEESEKVAEAAFDAAISTAVKATRGSIEYILAGAAISAMQVLNAIRGILPSIGHTSRAAPGAAPGTSAVNNSNVNNPFTSSAINAHERKLERNRELASVLSPGNIDEVAAVAAESVPAAERASVIKKIRNAAAQGTGLMGRVAVAAAAAPFIGLYSAGRGVSRKVSKLTKAAYDKIKNTVSSDKRIKGLAEQAATDAEEEGALPEEVEEVRKSVFTAAYEGAHKFASTVNTNAQYILAGAAISAMQVVNAVRGILPRRTRNSLGRNRTITPNGNVANPLRAPYPSTPREILEAPNTPKEVLNAIASRAANPPNTPREILEPVTPREILEPGTPREILEPGTPREILEGQPVSAGTGIPNPFIAPINARLPNQKRRNAMVRNPLPTEARGIRVAPNPLEQQSAAKPRQRGAFELLNPLKWGKRGGNTKKMHKYKKSKKTKKTRKIY